MFSSIVEAIFFHANKYPDKLCLVDDKQSITYKEYIIIIKKLAQYLYNLGIGFGDKVVVEANQSITYVAIEHALHLLGAVFVPLEHRSNEDKLVAVSEKCNARLIVANSKCNYRDSITYKELTDNILSVFEIEDFKFPQGNDISEILFSTGTTGKEKGIVLTHSSAVGVAENIANAVALNVDNIEMIPSPLNHSHGLRSYYANMLMGGAVVIVSNVLDMKRFYSSIEQYKVNSIDLVPSALSIILKLSKNKLGEYMEQFHYLEFGSSAMSEKDKTKIKSLLPNIPLYNFYGSTESGRTTVYNFNISEEKKGCIGKPTCNVALRIVDENKQEINSSVSSHGLLATAGSMNMLYYFNDENETKSVLENGFIYTKDEAYIDANGDVILMGRKDDVINVGGKKVDPNEIEDLVLKLDWVEDCGCVGVNSEYLGSQPKLFIQVKHGYEFDSVKIKKYLEQNLESFKVPQLIEKIDKVPRTFNGKLLRKVLRNM